MVFITYKDRLTCFGFRYLEAFFVLHDCRMETIDAEDLIGIVTSFAGRIYGARSQEAQDSGGGQKVPLEKVKLTASFKLNGSQNTFSRRIERS